MKNIGHFILIALLFLSSYSLAQNYLINVQPFGVDDGLPHREVNAIHQCDQGYLWVGTPQGICRFDGYQFENCSQHTDGFLHKNIWRILESADGWFWLLPIPPYDDFDIWHPVTREHTTFKEKFGEEHAMPLDYPVWWVVGKKDGTLVAPQNEEALFTYHPERGVRLIELKNIALFDYKKSKNFGRPVISVGESIWVITAENHVVEMDWEGAIIQSYEHTELLQFNQSIHSHSFPFAYFEWDADLQSPKKAFWIDREGKQNTFPKPYWYPSILPSAEVPFIGVDILYDDFSFFEMDGSLIFSSLEKAEKTAQSNFRSFIFTEQGDMWIGDNFGLQKVSIRKNIFKNYLEGDEGKWNPIRGIFADGERVIFNVEHLGPAIFEREGETTKQLNLTEYGFGIHALKKLSDGRIVFGQGRALGVLNKEDDSVESHLINQYTWAIFETDKNTLWLGSNDGLRVFDLATKSILDFEKYNGYDDLRNAHITHIDRDRNGNLWVCSSKGFFQADPEKGIVAQFSKKGEGEHHLPHDVIHHFFEDENGLFWLASGGGGLIRQTVDENGKSGWRQFTQQDGFSSNVTYAVYPDDFGNLWLSSDQGIMHFYRETGEVQAFLEADGLPNNEFNRLAHFQATDGQIYFGTINGATTFHPSDLDGLNTQNDPPLRITAYHQFDGEQNHMVERTAELSQKKEITLRPNDRFFRLELALLNFHEVNKTRFAYRFVGMSDEWEYTTERTLRFGRLPYGEYELQIKAQDARGHWSASEIHLPLTVLRPFYLRTWFLLLAAFILLAAAFLFYKMRTRALKERQRELEKIVAERTQKIREDKATIEKQAEELLSLEKLKSRFFANVSHELRTPLSLMIGPLDSLLKNETDRPEKERRLLEFVRNNSQHLLKLVNEILDLSKLETGRLEVKEEVVDFEAFLKPLVSQFSSFGDSETVKMRFDYQLESGLYILLDKGKFEKIVHNFLSNAIKFSPPKGEVKFSVKKENADLLVSVSDQGPGIHPNDLPHIFDRFYQSKQPDSATQGSTGIGLSLAAELAELLGGKIWAESELGHGSTFFFRFPMKIESAVDSPQSTVGSPQSAEQPQLESIEKRRISKTIQPFNHATVLVVEDNPDLRAYIQSILEPNYRVITAENGKVGYDCLLNTADCHLVISDLMMPVMDGFQFLEKIKSHADLRHLPVIMLTARADVRVKLRALRIGVDDYLTKPFVEEELKVRIENLLRNYRERQKAISENGQKKNGVPAAPHLAAVDAEWLKKVEGIFTERLSDSQFKISWAASEVHLSPRQFTRRLKQLTGLTPNNYLREIRLQIAKDYLLEGKYTSVKEVGFAVGFSSTKYFSNLFQARFGVLPSAYLN